MENRKRTPTNNPRTKLGTEKMPKWLWTLDLKGFHPQMRRYLKFLWRQRPAGCNWSREVRARYFKRTYHTIAKWDAFLVKWHLVWVTGQSTLFHRIGARPYYSKAVWADKCFSKPAPVRCVTNYTPYTAQQKNTPTEYYSSAENAQNDVEHLAESPKSKAMPVLSQGSALKPATPGGSIGVRLFGDEPRRKSHEVDQYWELADPELDHIGKIFFLQQLEKYLNLGHSKESSVKLANNWALERRKKTKNKKIFKE